MSKTDKQWRLPAKGTNYYGKITMMEVVTLYNNLDKNRKPETEVGNSGEFVETVNSLDIGKTVMNIKAEDGGSQEIHNIKKNQKESYR